MTLLSPALLPINSILQKRQWSLHQDIASESDDQLIGSIGRLGLLRPPIVRLGQDGYELICGVRRLDALRRLSHPPSSIGCSVLSEQAQPEDILFLVAEDQIQTGPLSPIEAARFINLVNEQCKQPNQELLNLAITTTSTTQRNRLLSLLKLEEPVRTSIHHGKISIKTGLNFFSLPTSERLFIHDLFIRLSLNANKQRRFLELMQIITGVEGCTVVNFITNHFPELCKEPIGNIPQQTTYLMKRLYEHSHPGISLAKEEFVKRVAKMNLPKNCRVSPSPAFEKDRVTLEVDFDDFRAFSEAWQKMKRFV